MTPLASKIFRNVKGPLAEATQRELASSQFFECTSLAAMAVEMRLIDGFNTGYSDMAQLPAPRTALEAVLDGHRLLFACSMQTDGYLSINCITELESGCTILWSAAFLPGTKKYRILSEKPLSEKAKTAIIIGTCIVEKFLCIINQPSLVEHQARDTDKRVMRTAAADKTPVRPHWHECRVRPGLHSGGNGHGQQDDEENHHQLHYVRKHFKPSLGRWIDGYWRGNADLGIYLKHYTVSKPVQAVLA